MSQEREIEEYIRDCLDPDGSNEDEVINDAVIELSVPREQVQAVYDRMMKL